MNNRRRNELKKALKHLEIVTDIVENALNEEEDCLDNIPENLQDSDRYEKMEEAINNMENAIDFIEDACNSIVEAIE